VRTSLEVLLSTKNGAATGTALATPWDGVQDARMKLVVSLAAILCAATACEKAPSKLDKQVEGTAMPKGGGGGGSLESRVAKLERYTEALDFLQKIYDQQKARQQAEEENEPDPNAVFAVDISGALKGNQVEGPAGALVTIVEAWDFA
jgi:hypothetical protein